MRTSIVLNHHFISFWLIFWCGARSPAAPTSATATAPTNMISVDTSALSFVLVSVLLISYHVTPWHCLRLSPWPFPCVGLSHSSFSCVSPKLCLNPWSGASPCLRPWPHLFSVPDPISVMGPDPGSALMSVYAASPDPMSILPRSLSLSLTLPLFQTLPSLISRSSSRCCLCFYLWPHYSQ